MGHSLYTIHKNYFKIDYKLQHKTWNIKVLEENTGKKLHDKSLWNPFSIWHQKLSQQKQKQTSRITSKRFIPVSGSEFLKSLEFPKCACVHAKSLQSCPTLCDPMDCSPPGSSVHGILQARILKWVAIPFSKGSSQPRDQISWGSCTAGGFFTAKPLGIPKYGE